MCIVIVSNTAWSIFNFRFGLLQTLLQHKFQVYVLAPRDASSAKLKAMGCEVIDLPMSAKGINPIEDLYLFIRLALCYKKIKPRLIIHYTIKPNIYGSLAAQLIGIPSLAVTTGLGFAYVSNNWLKKVVSRLYKIAFHYPKEVWFLNEEDRSVF